MQDNPKISVIGLGYVGLPLAIAFGKKYPTLGFDIDSNRIQSLQQGINPIDNTPLSPSAYLHFCNQAKDLASATIYIIAVPTPVDIYKKPDISYLLKASEMVGKMLKKGDIVIYESTTYPTCTNKECVPVLQKESGLTLNLDFFVGYSPERINPADPIHKLENITKITSGSTQESAQFIDKLYSSIVDSTYLAPSIEIAEAAKAVENAQRDLNIAFVNELCMIFERLEINTHEVLKAASTKWNFLPFSPGLVGGHCISVDPYYLIHIANVYDYHPRIITSGRFINDLMPSFIAQKFMKLLAKHNINPLGARIALLGASFKENCNDIRNAKAFEVRAELQEFGCKIEIYDSIIHSNQAQKEYGVEVKKLSKLKGEFDAFLLAIPHEEFLNFDYSKHLNTHGFIFDIKGVLKIKNHRIYRL